MSGAGVAPPDDDGATPTEQAVESIRSSVSPPASVCSSIRVSVTTSHSFCGLAEELLELRRVETQPDMRLRSAGGQRLGPVSFMSSICDTSSASNPPPRGVYARHVKPTDSSPPRVLLYQKNHAADRPHFFSMASEAETVKPTSRPPLRNSGNPDVISATEVSPTSKR